MHKKKISGNMLLSFMCFAASFFVMAAFTGCEQGTDCSISTAPADHTVCLETARHKPGAEYPDKNCSACHGSTLEGTDAAPSCYTCHAKIWSDNNTTDNSSAPSDHTVNKNGVMHKAGLAAPLTNCITCHGQDLKGAGAIPSCYKCHQNVWEGGSALPADHTVNKNGVMHKAGLADPLTNCIACHGQDLKGAGAIPSCYKCHQNVWEGGSALPADHTINKNGVMHKAGLADPLTNCIACHGQDLKGAGSIPSCYSCHGAAWLEDD